MVEVNPFAKRWCKKCHISNKEVEFFSGILSNKYGRKRFYFNICMPCKIEQRRIAKRKYYLKHRREQIMAAAKWNKENRARVRATARDRRNRIRMAMIVQQPAFAF